MVQSAGWFAFCAASTTGRPRRPVVPANGADSAGGVNFVSDSMDTSAAGATDRGAENSRSNRPQLDRGHRQGRIRD
jgi:hypothetical protein